MKKQDFAAFIFLALLLFTPLVFLVNLTKNPFLIQGVVLDIGVALMIIFLLLKVVGRKITFPGTPLDKFWIGWLLLSFISIISAAWHAAGGAKAVFFMGMESLLFLILNCVLVFYLSFYLAGSGFFKKGVTRVIFVVSLLAGVYGLLQYFGVEPFWPRQVEYFQGRVTSTFGNPAFLANFLVLVIPLLLTQSLKVSDGKVKLILYALLCLALTALLAAGARSAWLGALVTLAVLLVYLFKLGYRPQAKHILKVLAVVLLIGICAVLFSSKKKLLMERIYATINPVAMGTSLNQRFLIWACAGEMFIKHPILGQGWGLFELFYPSYQGKYLMDQNVARLKTHANHAHNEILQTAAELGVGGLLMGFYFLRVFFKRTNTLLKTGGAAADQLLAVGLLAGLVGMMTDSLFNVALHITAPALFFWAGMGILFGLGRTGGDENSFDFSSVSGKIAWITALGAFLVIILFNVFKMASALAYFQGMRDVALSQVAPDSSQKPSYLAAGVRELERSFTIFPFSVDTAYELANAYYRQNRLLAAESMYQEATEINFSYEEVYANYGVTELVLGRPKEARAAFEKALAINPNSPLAKDNLAGMKTP